LKLAVQVELTLVTRTGHTDAASRRKTDADRRRLTQTKTATDVCGCDIDVLLTLIDVAQTFVFFNTLTTDYMHLLWCQRMC
jgi:hypothetical protein